MGRAAMAEHQQIGSPAVTVLDATTNRAWVALGACDQTARCRGGVLASRLDVAYHCSSDPGSPPADPELRCLSRQEVAAKIGLERETPAPAGVFRCLKRERGL